MTNYRRGAAADMTTRRAVDDLQAHGIELPAAVLTELAAHETLTQRLKSTVGAEAHRAAALAALAKDPTADISAHAAAEAAIETEQNALMQARDVALARLEHALVGAADTIVATIRAVLFDPAVATLTLAAGAGKRSTTDLLRDGRPDMAQALADAPAAAGTVAVAYRLRARLYPRSKIDRQHCSRWVDPDLLDRRAVAGLENDDFLRVAIRQGATPWLGTRAEVDDASSSYADRLRAAAAAVR